MFKPISYFHRALITKKAAVDFTELEQAMIWVTGLAKDKGYNPVCCSRILVKAWRRYN